MKFFQSCKFSALEDSLLWLQQLDCLSLSVELLCSILRGNLVMEMLKVNDSLKKHLY